jgi:hypothetical protein
MSEVTLENLESKIYVLRGYKVMLQCDSSELEGLPSQFATTKLVNGWNYKKRANPYLFTENGVAMLSTVLRSQRAI